MMATAETSSDDETVFGLIDTARQRALVRQLTETSVGKLGKHASGPGDGAESDEVDVIRALASVEEADRLIGEKVPGEGDGRNAGPSTRFLPDDRLWRVLGL